MQALGNFSTVITSSSREMIDLTFEEEREPIVKTGRATSPAQIYNDTDMPQTITLRKRPNNCDSQDETPSRPPPKKQKSPSGTGLPLGLYPTIDYTSFKPVNQLSSLPIAPPPALQNNSFTQIPDSEGEDNDAIYGEDFCSDDIPEDTKEILGTPHKAAIILKPPNEGYDGNIVPESPRQISGDNDIEIGEERKEFSVRQHPQLHHHPLDELHPKTACPNSLIRDLAQTKPLSALTAVRIPRSKLRHR